MNPFIYALEQFFEIWDFIMLFKFPYLFIDLTFGDVVAGLGVLAICIQFYNVVFDRDNRFD